MIPILLFFLFLFSQSQVTIKITKPVYEEIWNFNTPSITKFKFIQFNGTKDATFNFQLFYLNEENGKYIKVLELGEARFPVKNEEEIANSVVIPTTDIIKKSTKLKIRIFTGDIISNEGFSPIFYIYQSSSYSFAYLFLIIAGIIGIIIMVRKLKN